MVRLVFDVDHLRLGLDRQLRVEHMSRRRSQDLLPVTVKPLAITRTR